LRDPKEEFILLSEYMEKVSMDANWQTKHLHLSSADKCLGLKFKDNGDAFGVMKQFTNFKPWKKVDQVEN